MLRAALCLALVAMTGEAHGHDWYADLRNEAGERCCGGKDCAPISDEYVQPIPGGYEVYLPAGYRFDWPQIDAFVTDSRARPSPEAVTIISAGGTANCAASFSRLRRSDVARV